MKRNLTKILKFLFAGCMAILPFGLFAQTLENYTLDSSHSSVLWKIDHLGFSYPSGKWFVEGTLMLDQKNPQNSKVMANIKLANINTGIAELDKHLRSSNFFDTEKFPLATFMSNKVEITGKNTAKVYGNLILHGISKPEVLNVTLNKSGDNPITDKPTVGFSATTELKRSDFGINTLLPMLGDTVKINIEIEAYKDINKNKH